MPIDWGDCPAVRMELGYVSGVAALRGDLRFPAETVLTSLDAGMSAAEVVEICGLETPLKDVISTYNYTKEQTKDGKAKRDFGHLGIPLTAEAISPKVAG